MKIVSIKQVLHWLFLVVGIISLMTLAVSVNSYLSFAREGYGIGVEVDSASIIFENGHWLMLKLWMDNPGKLDIVLETGNITLASGSIYGVSVTNPYHIPQETYPIDLPKKTNSPVLLWFSISEQDHSQIASTGIAEIRLRMEVFVPERYASTQLMFESVVEVGT